MQHKRSRQAVAALVCQGHTVAAARRPVKPVELAISADIRLGEGIVEGLQTGRAVKLGSDMDRLSDYSEYLRWIMINFCFND